MVSAGAGGGGAGTAWHGTVPTATLHGTQPRILPAGTHTGNRIGAPGLGGSWCRFQRCVPGSHQGTRNPEPRAAAPCKGKLRHTRTSSCPLDPLPRAPYSHRERRGQAGPGGVQLCKRSGGGSSVNVQRDTAYLHSGRRGTGRNPAPGTLRTQHPLHGGRARPPQTAQPCSTWHGRVRGQTC